MRETSLEEHFTKKSRYLVHLLIISVGLNLGLLATFITFILKEKKAETLLWAQTKPKRVEAFVSLSPSNGEVLKEYSEMPFDRLVQELKNGELLEQGYRRRDLALACLVAFHYFDVERSLPGVEIEMRPFLFGSPEKSVYLIPGFNQEKFEFIDLFIKREKWPFTTEGLFKQMKENKHDLPESLKETFFLSREFYSIERAFARLSFGFSRETLLYLLLEGSWNQMKKLTESIQRHPQGDIEEIGPLLAGFDQSKLAAYLLVALDANYAYFQLSNERLYQLISLLDERTDEAEIFLSRIATSERSGNIRLRAEQQIQSWGLDISQIPRFEDHVIQKGDSLWGLSRQFDVSMEMIREINRLDSDVLTPGKILRIPLP